MKKPTQQQSHRDLLLCDQHQQERRQVDKDCNNVRKSDATGLTADQAGLVDLSGYSLVDEEKTDGMEPLSLETLDCYAGMTQARSPQVLAQATTQTYCMHDPTKKHLSFNVPPLRFDINVPATHGQTHSKRVRAALSKKKALKSEKRASTTTSTNNVFTPILPLSAYNFFFRVERVRLLEAASYCNTQCHQNGDERGYMSNALVFYRHMLEGSSGEFQDIVLRDQWRRDPSIKRKHRKSHGQISFGSLARLISQSWRHMPDEIKQVFHSISARDFERYESEKRNATPVTLP